jgi:prolyl-tRNA editing enzyme YbaK/EbsC (Cys-tRNA(Pro) deacylase)
MNEPAYNAIIELLERKNVPYAAISHEPCRTSEESQAARERAGYSGVIGAKALLAKLYFKNRETFATIVLPGNHTLDKNRLIAAVPDLKKIRFATPEEMLALAGVIPGCMPPFAAPIFPDVPLLIIANALASCETIGFNAAFLERSIILAARDYFSAVTPAFVIDCSVPKTD